MAASRNVRPTLTVVRSPGAAGGPPPRADVELLLGLRRGDTAIAADFYRRVHPIVTRTVRRLLGRLDQDGEDITQTTMIHLIEAFPRYRGDCPFDVWVSAVSANVIYKHIRRRRLERSVFVAPLRDDDDVPWGAPRAGIFTGAISAREVAARIGEHLAAINANRAWSFLLHEVCGYSLEEIAVICQISVAAAQSRLSRGRRDLHERIRVDPALAGLLDGVSRDV